MKAFVQDSLDAHDEFLQSQLGKGSFENEENEPSSEVAEAEQSDQVFQNEKSDKYDHDQTSVEQSMEETGGDVNPGPSAQEQERIHENVFDGEQEEDDKEQQKQFNEQLFKRYEETREAANMMKQSEKQQPSLVGVVTPEPDEVVKLCVPGPLVTEMEDPMQLETIHLSSLLIDELPDLEDVDTEDFCEIFSPQQAIKPVIEVLTGDDDEDQSESVCTLDESKNPFLKSGCQGSTEEAYDFSSLLYPENDYTSNAVVSETAAEPATTDPPRSLIEELD